ncbi:MAG: nucleoside hydrolase [Clostridia bacterium]|nr:nucleoside hydrolase [Clostridia bacterium]
MTTEQYLKNLNVPNQIVDAVLDTDTYNEIDDQFALSYMMLSPERINVKAIYAAPFFNQHSSSPKDGMERSYDEIIKLLKLMHREDFIPNVLKGSEDFLKDEHTSLDSPAVRHLVDLAHKYSPEHPLYVIAIGAITNVASALLLDPSIAENIVIVWLGGHSFEFKQTNEFNMCHDFAAARIVMSSAAPFIQLPCGGVVSAFTTTGPEMKFWLDGKTELSTYLYNNTVNEVDGHNNIRVWSRVIWDVTAVGWLLNDNDRFMSSKLMPVRLPEYNGKYAEAPINKTFNYVYYIRRDPLMADLFKKITDEALNK